MPTPSKIPPPMTSWAPTNFELQAFVLTDVDGDARVMVVNGSHTESVNLARGAINKIAQKFSYTGIIYATPHPKNGQFEILIDIQTNNLLPDPPQNYSAQ